MRTVIAVTIRFLCLGWLPLGAQVESEAEDVAAVMRADRR